MAPTPAPPPPMLGEGPNTMRQQNSLPRELGKGTNTVQQRHAPPLALALTRSGRGPGVGAVYVATNSGAITSVIVASSLIRTCSAGPAVSLNGSPTVSPTTAAACSGLALRTTLPSG